MFVYTQVEECFASSERGGERIGGEMGKKQKWWFDCFQSIFGLSGT